MRFWPSGLRRSTQVRVSTEAWACYKRHDFEPHRTHRRHLILFFLLKKIRKKNNDHKPVPHTLSIPKVKKSFADLVGFQ